MDRRCRATARADQEKIGADEQGQAPMKQARRQIPDRDSAALILEAQRDCYLRFGQRRIHTATVKAIEGKGDAARRKGEPAGGGKRGLQRLWLCVRLVVMTEVAVMAVHRPVEGGALFRRQRVVERLERR